MNMYKHSQNKNFR